MKIKVVEKDGKYKKRVSLEAEDWLSIIIVLLVLGIVIIQLILWS